MTQAWRKLVEGATIRLPERRGQGIFVHGGYIITAAHCVDLERFSSVAPGDFFVQKVETAFGNVLAETLAAEWRADVAILGALDDQSAAKEYDEFTRVSNLVKPVRVWWGRPRRFREFSVHVLTGERKWNHGTAVLGGASQGRLCVELEQSARGGDSGGPVLNDEGELVGILSMGSQSAEAAFLQEALPAWGARQIKIAEKETQR